MIVTGTTLQKRYRIDKQIGQGGMGAVYVATDERFGSTVAIKETLCMDDNFRKAIEREARLLNSLKHSALPRVSDHFEEANGQFLVMEYIAGDDVASILERDQKAFSVEQVLKWADQLLDALDYLHNQVNPVIHRDIKPQNLKITPRGEIILLDFGLAKGNPTDAGNQTAAKSIFGYSRNYASLEQIQGTGTDPRSDLYSLAATLYHLLTNTPPEDALTRAMAVLSQKDDPLLAANTINPAVPRGIAGVLLRSMALNADERPASAVQMRRMLRDSDSYAYLADPATIATNVANTAVFGHQTRLMPEGTHADTGRETEAKTEVLPDYASQLTAVRAGDGYENATKIVAGSSTLSPPRKRRGVALAATAAGLILACGAVAGGIYLVKPSVFGVSTDQTEPPAATRSAPIAAANSNTASDPAANSSEPSPGGEPSDTAAGVSSSNAAPATGETGHPPPPGKPADTAKSGKSTATGKTTFKSDDGSEVEVNTPDEDGPTTVTRRAPNGKVTTVRVTPPRPNPNEPPSSGYDPFPNGFEPKGLTLQQRRMLRQIMKKNQERPVPSPEKTPN